MSNKRWCLLAAGALCTLLICIAALVVIVDPFEVYHRAWFYQPAYASETQMYANAGVAKSYEYDSVIIGTSVTENCRPSVYEQALGGRFIKLCMNGDTARDHAKMMEIAFRTHDVRRVVYGLDLFAVSQYYTNQKAVTPDYLYDANPLNDVYYLFNKSVLLRYIPQALARIGTSPEDSARDFMYFWNPPQMPTQDDLFALVDFALPQSQQPADSLRDFTAGHIGHNLLPYIRSHPDTVFAFFFPPYSLLYWAQQAQEGMLSVRMAQREQLSAALLAEPNVQLYDFQAHSAFTEDYSLYFDLLHYVSSVNDDMAQAMKDGVCRVHTLQQIEENSRAIEAAALALFIGQ